MAQFRFPLERLLEQRRREEREKQHAVAECEAQRVRVEDAIRARQQSIIGAKGDLRDALCADESGRFDVTSVRLQANASLHLMLQTQQLAIQLAGIHRRLDTARDALIGATTRRKAVELLRDRQYEAWRERERKREANELDEIASRRAGRDDELRLEVC